MENIDYSQYANHSGGSSAFSLMISIASVVAYWFLFVKANEDGWKAIIPFYNAYTLFDIVYGNGLKCLLLLVPFLNIALIFTFPFRLCKVFGKDEILWGVLMLLFSPIMLFVLAFSRDSEYRGPVSNFI